MAEFVRISGIDVCDEHARNEIAKRNVKANSIKLIAHRGACEEAPENTLKAFEIAGRQGFYGCECDVRLTADNEFVIMHDVSVDRTTNGTGNVAEMTLGEIKNLTIDTGTNINIYSNEKVPTLKEYLHVCYEQNMKPVIELEPEIPLSAMDDFYNILKEYGVVNECVVISFSTELLEELRKMDVSINLMPILDLNETNINYCSEHNFGINSSFTTISKEHVEFAHSKNVKVGAWTPTQQGESYLLSTYGVDYLTINAIYRGYSQENLPKAYGVLGMALYNDYEVEKYKLHGGVFDGFFSCILPRGIKSGGKFPDYYNVSHIRAVCFNPIKLRSTSSITYEIPNGYSMTIHEIDDEGNVGDKGWYSGTSKTSFDATTKYGIAFFKKADNSAFTEEDYRKLETIIKTYSY